MPEKNETANKSGCANNAPDDRRRKLRIFWIVISGVIAISYVVLILTSIYHPYLNERVKFGTETGLGLAVLIAVVAQIVVSRWQWEVMRDTLSQSREASERDQRAYITTQQVTMYEFEIGKNVSAELIVVNNGKTPAKDVTIYAHLWLLKEPPDVSQAVAVTPSGSAVSKYVIGPLGGQAIQSFVATVLTQQRWAEIANTDQRYYMWGVVVYRDVFDRSHKTTFCMVHGGAHKRQFTFCDRGNEID